jgi:hypothetical protein
MVIISGKHDGHASHIFTEFKHKGIVIYKNDNGKILRVKDVIGVAASKPHRLIPSGSQTIDGYPAIDCELNWMSLSLVFYNNNWYII